MSTELHRAARDLLGEGYHPRAVVTRLACTFTHVRVEPFEEIVGAMIAEGAQPDYGWRPDCLDTDGGAR